MSKVAKPAWPRLAVVAILAAPASAAAGAEQPAAAAAGAPALAAGAPTAYVTISNSSPLRANGHTMVPINTATNKPGPPIKVGKEPAAIAITPNGKTAYVVNGISDTVAPIPTATNKPGKQIQVGVRPQAVAVTPDSKTAYVVSQGDNATGPKPGNWNAYPLHEGYNYDLVGTANPSPWVPSAFRAGDTLTLDISPFSDSVPGHTGVRGEPFTGGSYQPGISPAGEGRTPSGPPRRGR